MTSEGLGEMFEGDSADMCARKFPLVSMGGRADRQACVDGERGPPSARAEILILILYSTTATIYHYFKWLRVNPTKWSDKQTNKNKLIKINKHWSTCKNSVSAQSV